MVEGLVTWFDDAKGFGWLIVLAGAVSDRHVGDLVKVHSADIQRDGDLTLDKGEHVSFIIERSTTRQPIARLVTPHEGPPPQHLLDLYAAIQESRQRPEMTEHYIFKDGRTIVLERGFSWDPVPGRDPIELERMTAHSAVRALASLCEGFIRPMSFGVTRQWVDEEFGVVPDGNPPRWNWFMKTPQSPPHVESAYVDPQVLEAETLDERSMLTAVDRALDDPCTAPDGDRLAWDELRVDHTWARLPEPERHIEADELHIDDYDNRSHRLRIPLERAHGHTWVAAPSRGVWDPFPLRLSKADGTRYPDGPELDEIIHLEITVNWSFWWEPGEGRAMLDRAVDRLRRQGWREAYPGA